MKINSKNIQIDGSQGYIQAVLDIAEEFINPHFISVNCHPHSLHGGTMTNKVVHTVSRSIAGLGIPSLRFNFRGVGESAGEYDEGIGEQEDLACVVDWMKEQYPNSKLILSGFSFGAFVSSFAASKICSDLLISIAPPVKRFDFDNFIRPNCEWTVIIGDEDELVEYQSVVDWVTSFESSPRLITMTGASHFFHGRLVELRDNIENLVSSFVSESV